MSVLNATIPRRDYNPREDHLKERIKDSVFLDFKGFCDPNTDLSYMMPSREHFTNKMEEMHVKKSDLVIVYDKYRNISAPRTHFMLNQVFGLPYVWLLNGTFEKWKNEGRPLDHGDSPYALYKKDDSPSISRAEFEFHVNQKKLKDFNQM